MNFKETEELKRILQARADRIKAIADAVQKKEPAITAKTDLPDGSTQSISQIPGPSGKTIYTVARDDKNVMTFATKRQLLDYLGE